MIPKNTLSSICADLTLEKAKENIRKEREVVEKKDASKIIKKKTNGDTYVNTRTILKDGSLESENSDEEELRKWREKRMQELKKKADMKKDGVYTEITEKDFLPTVLKNYSVVCHFYEKNFKRCEILDKHLIRLANIHLTTKFVKIEAKSCLFFMNKLNIKILPSLGIFIGGVLIHTCVGFEDFGNTDNFKTKDLEKFLFKMKILNNMDYSEDENESNDYNCF